MVIVVVARGIPSKKYKLQGIFEFDQARALAENPQNEIIYISLDMRSLRRWRTFGTYEYDKDNIHIVSINIPLGRVPSWIRDRIAIFKLRKALKKVDQTKKIDIIHAHFIENGYYSIRASEDMNIPVILTEHSSEMNRCKIKPRSAGMGRETYGRVTQLITVSKALSDQVERNFGINSLIIPDIVDIDQFKYETDKKKRRSDIISVASLIKSKGYEVLIKAFKIAFDNDDRKLFIVGSGKEMKSLIKLSWSLGISKRVIFTGTLHREEISRLMDEMLFFASASNTETFGVSFIEALSKGLPVLGTFCGGPEDFVNQNNGLLVEKDNIEEFAKGMKYLDDRILNYDRSSISSEIRKNIQVAS